MQSWNQVSLHLFHHQNLLIHPPNAIFPQDSKKTLTSPLSNGLSETSNQELATLKEDMKIDITKTNTTLTLQLCEWKTALDDQLITFNY
jgi:hypothetical protein